MGTVIFKTENAIFEFDLTDVQDRLTHDASGHGINTATRLLEFSTSCSSDPIKIPEGCDFFGYIALDLISQGNGSVQCKICNLTYQPYQLKPTVCGHGESPIKVNLDQKGGIRKTFGKKEKLPGMHGGKGYACPKDHELIAMLTWRT